MNTGQVIICPWNEYRGEWEVCVWGEEGSGVIICPWNEYRTNAIQLLDRQKIHSSCGPLIFAGLDPVVDVNEELYIVDIDTNILYFFYIN
jgi:hypothetical protein